MQVTVYLGIVSHEGEPEVFTSHSLISLTKLIINDVLFNYLEDLPSLKKYKVFNSIDFISDYEEEDYREILNKALFALESERICYKVKILELNQEINEGRLINTNQDLI